MEELQTKINKLILKGQESGQITEDDVLAVFDDFPPE